MSVVIDHNPTIVTSSSDTFGVVHQTPLHVLVTEDTYLPPGFPFRPVADRMPVYRAWVVLFQLQHKRPKGSPEHTFSESDFPEAPQGFSGVRFREIPFNLLLALWPLKLPSKPSFFVKASNPTYCGQKRIRWAEQDSKPGWVEEKAPFEPVVGDFVLAYYQAK